MPCLTQALSEVKRVGMLVNKNELALLHIAAFRLHIACSSQANRLQIKFELSRPVKTYLDFSRSWHLFIEMLKVFSVLGVQGDPRGESLEGVIPSLANKPQPEQCL